MTPVGPRPAHLPPWPTLEGSAQLPALDSVLIKPGIIELGSPPAGAAWSLGGFAISVRVPVSGGDGVNDWLALGQGIDLLLDDRAIDNFDASWAIPGSDIPETYPNHPATPIVTRHNYSPEIAIHDTSRLFLHVPGPSHSHYVPTSSIFVEWWANVEWLGGNPYERG